MNARACRSAPDRFRFVRCRGIGLASAVLVLLAGCFSDRPPAPGNGAAAVVSMTGDLTFDPATIRIAPGETVRWENDSSLLHTVTADSMLAADPRHVSRPAGAESFHSGDVPPGGVYEHRFPVAGRYDYVCLPHELAGMVGTVIVE